MRPARLGVSHIGQPAARDTDLLGEQAGPAPRWALTGLPACPLVRGISLRVYQMAQVLPQLLLAGGAISQAGKSER